jgi:hypothetical protein
MGVTVAVNCCVALAATVADVGETVTLKAEVTVTCALPLLLGSATLTAVTV